MKHVISIILAIIIGYFVLGALWWLMFKAFWIAFELTKVFMVLLIAVPLYIIIRRKVFR